MSRIFQNLSLTMVISLIMTFRLFAIPYVGLGEFSTSIPCGGTRTIGLYLFNDQFITDFSFNPVIHIDLPAGMSLVANNAYSVTLPLPPGHILLREYVIVCNGCPNSTGSIYVQDDNATVTIGGLVLGISDGLIIGGGQIVCISSLKAEAGPDQISKGCVDPVKLEGIGSAPDPANLNYLWEIINRPADSDSEKVKLDNPSSMTPSFIPDRSGFYEVQLKVSIDGQSWSNPDTVIIEACCPNLSVDSKCALPGHELLVTIDCVNPANGPYEIAVVSDPGPPVVYSGITPDQNFTAYKSITVPINANPIPQEVSIVLMGTVSKTTFDVRSPQIEGIVQVCYDTSDVNREVWIETLDGQPVDYAFCEKPSGYFWVCNIPPGQYRMEAKSNSVDLDHFKSKYLASTSFIQFSINDEGVVLLEWPYNERLFNFNLMPAEITNDEYAMLYDGTYGDFISPFYTTEISVLLGIKTIQGLLVASGYGIPIVLGIAVIEELVMQMADDIYTDIADDRLIISARILKSTYNCKTGERKAISGKLRIEINGLPVEFNLDESIQIFGNSPITLFVHNPFGLEIGYDSFLGIEVNNYPDYLTYSGNTSHPQIISMPFIGNFFVQVNGKGDGPYTLKIQHKIGENIIDQSEVAGLTSTDKEESYVVKFDYVDSLLYISEINKLKVDAVFKKGDSNSDGTIDISDALNTLSFLFLGQGKMPCFDAADANDDGAVDISDAVSTLSFLFLGGKEIPAPYPSCGPDPTVDSLPDCQYDPAMCK